MKQKLVWIKCQVSNVDLKSGKCELSVSSHQHNNWGSYWGTEPEHYTLYESEAEAKKFIQCDEFIKSIYIDEGSNWGTHKE